MSALTQTRDHCRHMAEHHDTPRDDRTLWTQIADEIDAYLSGATLKADAHRPAHVRSRPMTDTHCAIGGERHGPANPVICLNCHLTTNANLDWINRNYQTLTAHLEPSQTGTTTRTIPASKPPLRVDVLTLESRGGITGILGSWVQLLVEDRDTDPPNHRLRQGALITAQIDLIKTHLTWLLEQPFAPELADEISSIRADMSALLGETERTWDPIPGRWRCPVITDVGPCGQALRQKRGEWRIRCRGCGAEWIGDQEFERLGQLLGCEVTITLEQATTLARVSRATLYRIIAKHGIPVDGNTIDSRDLAIALAHRSA